MGWTDSVGLILTDDERGSGTFIGPDLVLTAAHVVCPLGGAPADHIEVHLTNRPLTSIVAYRIAITDQWLSNTVDAKFYDLALLRVTPSADDLGLGYVSDFAATTETSATIFGFPAYQDIPGLQDGTIVSAGARFLSDGFVVGKGMSGGPIMHTDADNSVALVGVVTFGTIVGATNHTFTGLPVIGTVLQALLGAV